MSNTARVALITGGGSGIGLAVAKRFAAEGMAVAIVGRDGARLTQARDEVCGTQPAARIASYEADVADESQINTAIARAGRELGPVTILVNNAGVSPKHEGRKSLVAEMSTQEWRRALDINLTGAFLAARACIPYFNAERWGRVISISSVAARTRSDVVGAHYAAAKAGLFGLSRVLALELAPLGVTVNCVAPGQIDTGMTDPQTNAAYLPRIPVGRIGLPDDIASAVAYLASPEASFITGAILDVTGGSFMG